MSGELTPAAMPRQTPEYEVCELGPRKTKYCLCVFVINEGQRLHAQLSRMRQVMHLADVIIADGGSGDGSVAREIMLGFGVRAVLVKRGPGKLGAQMRMAFDYALKQGYEGVAVVDGNNKDDVAASLGLMLAKLESGFDHVQGSRFVPGGRHENTPFLRHWGVKLLHSPLIRLASGFHYTDTTNGFRAYSRRLLESPEIAVFRDVLSGYELHYYLAIEAARRGFRVCEVPATRVYPASGGAPTKISPLKGNLKILGVLFKAALGRYRPAG